MGLVQQSPPELERAWIDRLGITASMGCAIHCLLTGIFFLVLPGIFEISEQHIPSEWLQSEWIHWALALIVVPVAAFSLSRGYRLHRKPITLVLGGLGVFLILGGLALHPLALETVFTMAGGVLLALAHFLNLKGLRGCHLKSR